MVDVDTKKTLGDMSGDDHLKSHIQEEYMPGSLLVNAMKEAGYGQRQIAHWYYHANESKDPQWGIDTFKRALRKYLFTRLRVTIY